MRGRTLLANGPTPTTGELAAKKDEADEGEASSEAAIALKPWDPKTPYIEALKAAPAEKRFEVYMAQKKEFGGSPAFFLDCSDFFMAGKDGAAALQVLSNIAELELENAALLRILGHRLEQLGELDLAAQVFEEVLKIRGEEPQSYRDLALVLAQRAQAGKDPARAKADYARALELLAHVVMNKWDRFDEIEVIALMELNAILPRAKAAGAGTTSLDERLIRLLDADVRIIMTWDADMTDIDVWVVEPSGEKAFYGHTRTTIGGNFSRDFTQGYGPEEYLIKKAMGGVYKIQTNFYGSTAQRLSGAVTVQADVFTNFGRPNEKRRSITLRLKDQKETIDIGQIEF